MHPTDPSSDNADAEAPDRATVVWSDTGQPRSPRFGDVYRSLGEDGQGGLAQARHVFLAGCGLGAADGGALIRAQWHGRDAWRVLENGFGLGLNFLATWLAWQLDPGRPRRLFYEATEAWPPTADDIRRSAAPFAAVAGLGHALASQWETLQSHGTLALADGSVLLRLHTGSAQTVLAGLEPPFDSVFLDGFSPKRNPDMWTPTLLHRIGELTRPGGLAATWCVARSVRDALASAGFQVDRRPGLPPKRHCLVARRMADPAPDRTPPTNPVRPPASGLPA
ncbi:MAG: tRNA (5-methylaminomethyl-2-thiouridine)(34)-methyltransferase MnmD [Burkholderiaceae bacterium]